MGGLSWPVTYVALIVIYVAIHYMFVSQSSQVLALLGVFLDVGIMGCTGIGLRWGERHENEDGIFENLDHSRGEI